jgi:autotransporter adhesin
MVVSNANVTATGGGSQFVLSSTGANFSNSTTGAPIQVHGVADGTATHDAVNYGQLRKVIAGVAGVAAMANIPQVDQGKTFSVGAGVSSFMGANALAIGATYRLAPNAVVKASVAALNNYNNQAVYGLGAAMSW